MLAQTVGNPKTLINRGLCWSNAIDFPNNDEQRVIL